MATNDKERNRENVLRQANASLNSTSDSLKHDTNRIDNDYNKQMQNDAFGNSNARDKARIEDDMVRSLGNNASGPNPYDASANNKKDVTMLTNAAYGNSLLEKIASNSNVSEFNNSLLEYNKKQVELLTKIAESVTVIGKAFVASEQAKVNDSPEITRNASELAKALGANDFGKASQIAVAKFAKRIDKTGVLNIIDTVKTILEPMLEDGGIRQMIKGAVKDLILNNIGEAGRLFKEWSESPVDFVQSRINRMAFSKNKGDRLLASDHLALNGINMGYNEDKVDYTQKATLDLKMHKSVTEIIPDYLSEILGTLKGQEARVFDWDNNSYKNRSELILKEEAENRKKDWNAPKNTTVNGLLELFEDLASESNSGKSRDILSKILKSGVDNDGKFQFTRNSNGRMQFNDNARKDMGDLVETIVKRMGWENAMKIFSSKDSDSDLILKHLFNGDLISQEKYKNAFAALKYLSESMTTYDLDFKDLIEVGEDYADMQEDYNDGKLKRTSRYSGILSNQQAIKKAYGKIADNGQYIGENVADVSKAFSKMVAGGGYNQRLNDAFISANTVYINAANIIGGGNGGGGGTGPAIPNIPNASNPEDDIDSILKTGRDDMANGNEPKWSRFPYDNIAQMMMDGDIGKSQDAIKDRAKAYKRYSEFKDYKIISQYYDLATEEEGDDVERNKQIRASREAIDKEVTRLTGALRAYKIYAENGMTADAIAKRRGVSVNQLSVPAIKSPEDLIPYIKQDGTIDHVAINRRYGLSIQDPKSWFATKSEEYESERSNTVRGSGIKGTAEMIATIYNNPRFKDRAGIYAGGIGGMALGQMLKDKGFLKGKYAPYAVGAIMSGIMSMSSVKGTMDRLFGESRNYKNANGFTNQQIQMARLLNKAIPMAAYGGVAAGGWLRMFKNMGPAGAAVGFAGAIPIGLMGAVLGPAIHNAARSWMFDRGDGKYNELGWFKKFGLALGGMLPSGLKKLLKKDKHGKYDATTTYLEMVEAKYEEMLKRYQNNPTDEAKKQLRIIKEALDTIKAIDSDNKRNDSEKQLDINAQKVRIQQAFENMNLSEEYNDLMAAVNDKTALSEEEKKALEEQEFATYGDHVVNTMKSKASSATAEQKAEHYNHTDSAAKYSSYANDAEMAALNSAKTKHVTDLKEKDARYGMFVQQYDRFNNALNDTSQGGLGSVNRANQSAYINENASTIVNNRSKFSQNHEAITTEFLRRANLLDMTAYNAADDEHKRNMLNNAVGSLNQNQQQALAHQLAAGMNANEFKNNMAHAIAGIESTDDARQRFAEASAYIREVNSINDMDISEWRRWVTNTANTGNATSRDAVDELSRLRGEYGTMQHENAMYSAYGMNAEDSRNVNANSADGLALTHGAKIAKIVNEYVIPNIDEGYVLSAEHAPELFRQLSDLIGTSATDITSDDKLTIWDDLTNPNYNIFYGDPVEERSFGFTYDTLTMSVNGVARTVLQRQLGESNQYASATNHPSFIAKLIVEIDNIRRLGEHLHNENLTTLAATLRRNLHSAFMRAGLSAGMSTKDLAELGNMINEAIEESVDNLSNGRIDVEDSLDDYADIINSLDDDLDYSAVNNALDRYEELLNDPNATDSRVKAYHDLYKAMNALGDDDIIRAAQTKTSLVENAVKRQANIIAGRFGVEPSMIEKGIMSTREYKEMMKSGNPTLTKKILDTFTGFTREQKKSANKFLDNADMIALAAKVLFNNINDSSRYYNPTTKSVQDYINPVDRDNLQNNVRSWYNDISDDPTEGLDNGNNNNASNGGGPASGNVPPHNPNMANAAHRSNNTSYGTGSSDLNMFNVASKGINWHMRDFAQVKIGGVGADKVGCSIATFNNVLEFFNLPPMAPGILALEAERYANEYGVKYTFFTSLFPEFDLSYKLYDTDNNNFTKAWFDKQPASAAYVFLVDNYNDGGHFIFGSKYADGFISILDPSQKVGEQKVSVSNLATMVTKCIVVTGEKIGVAKLAASMINSADDNRTNYGTGDTKAKLYGRRRVFGSKYESAFDSYLKSKDVDDLDISHEEFIRKYGNESVSDKNDTLAEAIDASTAVNAAVALGTSTNDQKHANKLLSIITRLRPAIANKVSALKNLINSPEVKKSQDEANAEEQAEEKQLGLLERLHNALTGKKDDAKFQKKGLLGKLTGVSGELASKLGGWIGMLASPITKAIGKAFSAGWGLLSGVAKWGFNQLFKLIPMIGKASLVAGGGLLAYSLGKGAYDELTEDDREQVIDPETGEVIDAGSHTDYNKVIRKTRGAVAIGRLTGRYAAKAFGKGAAKAAAKTTTNTAVTVAKTGKTGGSIIVKSMGKIAKWIIGLPAKHPNLAKALQKLGILKHLNKIPRILEKLSRPFVKAAEKAAEQGAKQGVKKAAGGFLSKLAKGLPVVGLAFVAGTCVYSAYEGFKHAGELTNKDHDKLSTSFKAYVAMHKMIYDNLPELIIEFFKLTPATIGPALLMTAALTLIREVFTWEVYAKIVNLYDETKKEVAETEADMKAEANEVARIANATDDGDDTSDSSDGANRAYANASGAIVGVAQATAANAAVAADNPYTNGGHFNESGKYINKDGQVDEAATSTRYSLDKVEEPDAISTISFATEMEVKKYAGKVRYQMGGKSPDDGAIDCSGWVRWLLLKGKNTLEKDKGIKMDQWLNTYYKLTANHAGGAAAIAYFCNNTTGLGLINESLNVGSALSNRIKDIQPGMIIASMSPHSSRARENNLFLLINHIAYVYRDSTTGEIFVTQSSTETNGVSQKQTIASYIANRIRNKNKVYIGDPWAMFRKVPSWFITFNWDGTYAGQAKDISSSDGARMNSSPDVPAGGGSSSSKANGFGDFFGAETAEKIWSALMSTFGVQNAPSYAEALKMSELNNLGETGINNNGIPSSSAIHIPKNNVMSDDKGNTIETSQGRVKYIRADGTSYTKIGGSVAWRCNNPGNIMWLGDGAYAKKLGAIGFYATSPKNKYSIFPSEQAGWNALYRLLFVDDNTQDYKNLKATVVFYKFAPSAHGNNPDAYTADVVKAVGSVKIMREYSEPERIKFMLAIKQMEGWIVGKIDGNMSKGIDVGKDALKDKKNSDGKDVEVGANKGKKVPHGVKESDIDIPASVPKSKDPVYAEKYTPSKDEIKTMSYVLARKSVSGFDKLSKEKQAAIAKDYEYKASQALKKDHASKTQAAYKSEDNKAMNTKTSASIKSEDMRAKSITAANTTTVPKSEAAKTTTNTAAAEHNTSVAKSDVRDFNTAKSDVGYNDMKEYVKNERSQYSTTSNSYTINNTAASDKVSNNDKASDTSNYRDNTSANNTAADNRSYSVYNAVSDNSDVVVALTNLGIKLDMIHASLADKRVYDIWDAVSNVRI